MISIIRGRILNKTPTSVTVDVGGIGFSLSVPLSTSQKIGDVGVNVLLYTRMELSKDGIHFYGFSTEEERQLFDLITSIQGIGSKAALKILSGLNREELERIIEENDVKALSEIKGVGRKKASRIIFELKGRVFQKPEVNEDAIKALVSLGLKRNEAKERLKKIPNAESLPLPEILRLALKNE